MKRTLLGAALALSFAGAAQADIIPTFVSTTAVAGGFDWTYRAIVSQDERADAGNFFTLYDFVGFTGITSAAAGFAGSSALVGPTPAGVLPPDNPTIANVTFTRTGATITGPSDLGLFTIRSTVGTAGTGTFTAQATRSTGPQAGTPIANIGLNSITLPGVTPVPEPTTWGLLAGGLAVLGWMARRRAR